MLKMTGFSEAVHDNAKAHGWWDEPRQFYEITALIHSEWSEALESYRAKELMVWHDEQKGKPEGIAVEIIDGCIRVLDWFGSVGQRIFPNSVESLIKMMSKERISKVSEYSLPQLVSVLHCLTVDACRAVDMEEQVENMQDILSVAFCWLDANGLDVESLLLEKHEYNKSRPYRHGNKAL